MKPSKFLPTPAVLAAIATTTMMMPRVGLGACTRNDVDYYLSQGFTREQVVALCTGKPAAKSKSGNTRADQPESEEVKGEPLPAKTTTKEAKTPPSASDEYQPLAEAMGDDLEDFLRSAIDGYDVHVSDQALHYTRRTCIEYGPYNQFGIKTEACPDVRYTVARTGLKIKSVRQALLILGNLEVTVSGRIDRKILDLDRYHAKLRGAIQSHLEVGPETVIPIRDGVSEARLQTALRSLPL